MRRQSRKRASESREYSKLRKAFLIAHPICQACEDRPSVEIHHLRGRIGRLLNMTEFWMALDSQCHAWIGDHKAKARELGWLSSARDFNTVPESTCQTAEPS